MEKDVNFQRILTAIRRGWKTIVITVLTITLISSTTTFFLIKPTYETQVKLFIGKEETKKEGYNESEVHMYQKLLKTYSEVIKTKDLANAAIKKANIDIKPAEVLNNLTIVPVADTQILEIKYKSTSPTDGYNLINSIKDEFIKLSEDIVQKGNIQVLESAQIPKKPVSPNKVLNIGLSIVLSLGLGAGIVLLKEFMNNSFRGKEEIEKELGLPVIGVIPDINSLER